MHHFPSTYPKKFDGGDVYGNHNLKGYHPHSKKTIITDTSQHRIILPCLYIERASVKWRVPVKGEVA